MATFVPVDDDPFNQASSSAARLEPVDFDPFKEPPKQVAPASGVFPAVNDSGLASVPAGTVPATTPPQSPSGVSAPPPSGTPIQSNEDPGWLQESLSQTKRGWHSFQRGRYLVQHLLGTREGAIEDFLTAVEQTPQVNAENVVSPQTRAAEEELEKLSNSGGGGFLPSLGVYARNPRLALGTFLQSASSMIPTAATVPLGTVAGAAGGPLGMAAGARAGVALGSAMGDFGSAFEDYVNENFKPKNRDEWKAVLADPQKVNDALRYATIHSGTVGAFDALGMKVGGSVGGKIIGGIEKGVGRSASGLTRNVAVGVAGAPASSAVGAAGEASGQYLGKGSVDPTAVAGEFVGGLVGDVATTGVESVLERNSAGKQTPATTEDIQAAGAAIQGQTTQQGPLPTEPGLQPAGTGATSGALRVDALFDPKPEDISGSFSADEPSMFYSPLRKYVEEKGPGAATAEVWQNTIRNAPGVKAEEVNDLALPDYFVDKPGKITKAELLDHIDTNAVRVEETTRANGRPPEDVANELGRQAHLRELQNYAPDAVNDPFYQWENLPEPTRQEWISRAIRANKPQYEGYTLPGERDGYTELTLHVPTRNVEGDNTQRNFVGGHYAEPNVVVHARMTDRVDANGTPMLLIEEIQSDWHQRGRREGYRVGEPPVARKLEGEVRYDPQGDPKYPWQVIIDGKEDNRITNEAGAHTELQDRLAQLQERADREAKRGFERRVPDGPFKTSWDELAFKRMLRWAADKGYTRLAWVNAAEQSRRYPGDARRDAGMKQFYDRVIPSIAKRWAKRLGGTWGTTTIPQGNTRSAIVTDTGVGTFVVTDENGQRLPGTHTHTNAIQAQIEADRINRAGSESEVQYIDLPRAALDVVQQGLPLYSDMAESNNVGVTTSPKAEEIGQQMGEALQHLVKTLDLRVPVQLIFHEGTVIAYDSFRIKNGRPMRTRKRAKALGMAVGYNTARPEIHIALGWHKTAEEVWGTITHELGHVVMATTYARADANVKTAVRAAYDEWRSKIGTTKNMQDIIKRRDNAVIALYNTRGFGPERALPKSPTQRQYWLGFEEWFAEQTARWATSQEKPLSTIEKFFHGLGTKLKSIFQAAQRQFGLSFEPAKAMNDWLNSFHTGSEPFAENINTVNTVNTTRENQQQMGPEEKAVERQPETVAVREVVGQIFNGRPPKEVQETIAYADKFNKIYKWMLGIHQVAQRNPHIVPLQEYTETIAVAQLTKQQIMIRAQEVLKLWNKLGGKQGDAVAALLDDVANMVYRTADDIKNKVSRFPTQQELAILVQKHGVTQQGLAVFKEIAATFQEHLTRYEAVLRNEANKITDPKMRADRHDEITLQIRALSGKPYFPFMRFGEYTITVRNAAKQVIHFETFEKRAKRDRAMKEIQKQLQPDDTIQAGMLDRQTKPLLGVPTQLLDLMAEKLKMSPAQRDALEQLKFELSPAQSFKHRFQHKNRIAGYSQDFRRAYANYFFHGANHLMKAMYADRLRGLSKATREETANILDATTRHEIVAYMNDHLENWLDPKSDWAAIRSIAFLWSLAFSPAAAAQNLTQTLMTTYPFLAQQFGDAKAIAAMMRTGGDFTTFYKKGTIQNATDFELRAIARGISDGIINEAMAPELAGFAEGRTLGLGFGGNELQRGVTKFNEWGAKLFELAEQVNRRLVFRAALKLAQENPGAKYVKDMQVKHRLHYDALRKEGWTEAEANAYVVARDATITTQFQYGREYAPRFMRGKLRSIFVFKTFIQNYVLFLANYPSAAVRSVLILGFLGGLMGVPGADDLKEILKAIGWRMFGKDFDLEKEARQLILQMVGKDNNGADIADIALHGIARKGYGIPAFMDMLGGTVGVDVPMPTFDRSKSISAGTLLPIELGKLFGPPTQSADTVIASQAQKASGAVFGAGFNIYKAITNSKLDWKDSKRWERAVPRALGSLAHATRLYREGGERNNSGTQVIKYDVRDTEQLMEVIGVAAGYTPYRASLYWDATMAKVEAAKLWDIRREGLMKQMGNAVLGRDTKEIDRVREAIKKFNEGLPPEARGKAISSDAMRLSIGSQARSRAAQEQGSSVKKSDIPIFQEIQKLYPESQVTGVRRVRGTP